MPEENTTVIVQRYLDELTGEAPAEPVVRPLLDRAFLRLQRFCATLLYHDYPRLTHPPLNLQTDELLSAVVERLLKALREARPRTVREFFALAGQHMRWELNDLARRLDNQPAAVELREGQLPAPASSDSGVSPDGRRMLEAIDSLPEDEREAFDLMRIQGLTYAEAAPADEPGHHRVGGCHARRTPRQRIARRPVRPAGHPGGGLRHVSGTA